MLRPVMDHVASLAEGREVSTCVVRGVVIPMRGSQDDQSPAGAAEDVSLRPDPDPTPPTIAPAPIAEVVDLSLIHI